MAHFFKNSWKYLGIAIIIYVFTMIFLTPLGPGLESSNAFVESNGVATIEVQGYATHFENSPSEIRGFLQCDEGQIIIECSNIDVKSNTILSLNALMPDTAPSSSWNLHLSVKNDGALYLPNAIFKKPIVSGTPVDLSFAIQDISNDDFFQNDHGFQFPYQPRIVESIRNLMLHVPMWFTMFLLMGIGFVQSIKTLKISPNTMLHDAKALSSIKVGIVFGILGLITGSLWARFTWGAWWVNDPQLNGALVSVMIYSGYLILRSSITDASSKARLSAVYSLFAFVILMVLLMVLPRFTESLHPGKSGNPAFSKYDLDSSLRLVFYPAVIGWMIIGCWMYKLTLRLELLKEKIQSKKEH